MLRLLVLGAGLGCTAPAFAQPSGAPDWLTLSGAARLRYETLSGQPRAGFSVNDQLISWKATLLVEASVRPFRFGVEIYDARVALDDSDSGIGTNEVNALEPVQLYAAAAFARGGVDGELTLGRMTMNLGSRRLISNDDYRNTANGFTGARLDLEAGDAAATMIYAMPQARLPADLPSLRAHAWEWDRESDDLVLYGVIAALPAGLPRASLQPVWLRLEESDRPGAATRDRRLHTFGLRYWREPRPGAFDFDVEGFAQTGTVSVSAAPGAARQDVSASFLHAETGYQWDAPWRPRLALEIDIASGDRPGGDYGRFDTLYGMRRAEIAPAGIYNAVGRANLSGAGVRLELAPDGRTDAFITGKALSLEADTDAFSTTGVRDITGRAGGFAGYQADVRLRYWLAPDSLRLELNALYLAKGRFYDDAPNSPSNGDTAYFSVALTTTF